MHERSPIAARSTRLRAAAAALLSIAACERGYANDKNAGAAAQPPEVNVVTIAPADVPRAYEFSAQVVPYRRVEVRARVDGIIRERRFVEGSIVGVGQLLYRIEPARYEAALRAAEARVDAARLRSERDASLLAQHAVAQQDVENARSELESAEAQLAQARRDFDDTFVRAELAGRVGRTMLDVGARVTGPGDLLTTIDRLDSVYVEFSPSGEQMLTWTRDPGARALANGDGRRLAVEVTLPDGTTVPRVGRLDFVAPSVDAATGTQGLRALFPNPDRLLVPGQFVRARLLGFTASRALTVPVRAVQTTLGRAFVYVVAEGDTVRVRDIETAAWEGDHWIVRSGLHAGDRVVVDGIQKIVPGRQARPIPARVSTDASPRSGA